MSGIVLIGAQWGDEGKGKATDLIGTKVDYVARFNGGNNAGHSVMVGDQMYALHLLPSGINEKSWYWTISRINDLVAKYPDLFEDGAIRTEMERLESQWMQEQNLSDKEQIALASQIGRASCRERV